MKAWYIRRGLFAIPLLQGRSAEVMRTTPSHVFVQFDNTNLPKKFTNGSTPFFISEVIVATEWREDGSVVLDYCGKTFIRRIKNGRFTFRKVECEIYEPNNPPKSSDSSSQETAG